MPVYFFNTLSRTKEELHPIENGKVRLYTCGPTVYNYAHIGNLRTYVFEDVLRRTLEVAGYDVRHVMNVTDVGHLESDADVGEDKMMLASRRESRSPWEIARYYEDAFFRDCAALGIKPPGIRSRATEHIDEIIAFIVELEKRGHAYVVDGNVYFDVATYPPYAELAHLVLDQEGEGARVEADPRKRNQVDFVLWFSHSKYPNQIMKWDSPWGVGFPGWHIECSVMGSKYLGDRIDIHCGGIDHIPVHHTNERAQSEARFGHRWVNIWMHGEFLNLDGAKMAKSLGGFVTLSGLVEQGFEPMHYRYFCLGARYRHPLRFSSQALSGARSAFESLKNRVIGWKLFPDKGRSDARVESYRERFWAAVFDDLDTPGALAVMWEMVKDPELSSRVRLDLMTDFDRLLGFNVDAFHRPTVSADHARLIATREDARKSGDWATADAIRARLREAGIQIKDTPEGPDWYVVRDD